MWASQGAQDFNNFGQSGGFSTPGQGEEKKRSTKRNNNIVPVTIGQIITAKHEDDAFVSGKLELAQVTLVGLIKSVKESATRIDYELDDMTGPPIEVRHFNESDETEEGENQTSNAFPVNTYVRVCGLIRAFGGKRTVNCHKMMAIPDLNELTCHMLEVIYASAGSQQQSTAGGNSGGFAGGAGTSDMGDGAQIPGLTPLQSQIQMIIRKAQSDKGCSVNEISESMRSVAPKAIREAIDFLCVEGLIYSTIDDDHYQATDS